MPVQYVGSCVITMFWPAAAAFLITSKVDITVVAMPVTGVSTPPDLNVSVGPPRHGTPRFALIRSTTCPAVSRDFTAGCANPRSAAPASTAGTAANWRREMGIGRRFAIVMRFGTLEDIVRGPVGNGA